VARPLDPSTLRGLLALGDDGPNNAGDKIGRDPSLQVSAKGRSHQTRQLLSVVRHVAHPAVERGLLCNGAGLSLGIRAGCRRVLVPQAALVTVVLAFICWLRATHLVVGRRIQPDRAGWRSVSPASPHLKELLCL
jgi:hypothetical protein